MLCKKIISRRLYSAVIMLIMKTRIRIVHVTIKGLVFLLYQVYLLRFQDSNSACVTPLLPSVSQK
jgi:hypothetical protein